jgi:hypothetical protein
MLTRVESEKGRCNINGNYRLYDGHATRKNKKREDRGFISIQFVRGREDVVSKNGNVDLLRLAYRD